MNVEGDSEHSGGPGPGMGSPPLCQASPLTLAWFDKKGRMNKSQFCLVRGMKKNYNCLIAGLNFYPYLCVERSAFPEMSATRTSLEQYAVNCLIMVWAWWPSSLVGTRIRAFTSCSRTLWIPQTQRKWSRKRKRQQKNGYWVHIRQRNIPIPQ